MSTTELYDLTPLREWVLETKPSLLRAAETLGYWRSTKSEARRPDTRRLMRDLGIVSEGRDAPPRCHTSWERAAKLARALGADPLDVGL